MAGTVQGHPGHILASGTFLLPPSPPAGCHLYCPRPWSPGFCSETAVRLPDVALWRKGMNRGSRPHLGSLLGHLSCWPTWTGKASVSAFHPVTFSTLGAASQQGSHLHPRLGSSLRLRWDAHHRTGGFTKGEPGTFMGLTASPHSLLGSKIHHRWESPWGSWRELENLGNCLLPCDLEMAGAGERQRVCAQKQALG